MDPISDNNNLLNAQTRVKQQNVAPASIKQNLQSFFDPTTGRLEFKTAKGTIFFTIDPVTGQIISTGETTTGDITATGNISSNGTIASGGSITARSNISARGNVYAGGQIIFAFGGQNGGGSGSFFISTTTYFYINSARFTIDPQNYAGLKFYLRAVYRAGAFGDPLRTFTMTLFDVATGNPVINSTISGSQTSSNDTFATLPVVTGSVDFRSNLITGSRDYVIGIKSDIAGSFVDLYAASLIISAI